MPAKLGINGFGRIGRLVFRAAMANPEVEVPGWIVRKSDVLAQVVLSNLLDTASRTFRTVELCALVRRRMVHLRAHLDFRCRGGGGQRPVHGPGLHGPTFSQGAG